MKTRRRRLKQWFLLSNLWSSASIRRFLGLTAAEPRFHRLPVPTTTLRRATFDDIAALTELMEAAHQEAGFALDRPRAALAFTTLLRDESRGAAWIALRAGRAAGYVSVIFKLSFETGGLDAFIEDLFVQPAARRQGTGAGLLALTLEHCRKQGICAVHVDVGADNVSARSLYSRQGFRDRGRILLTAELGTNPLATKAGEALL